MNFELTSDQKMLAQTVSQFTKTKSTVERFRKLREAGTSWEREVWAEMGELGWLSVPFPEEAGGFGAGFVEVAIIAEGLGKTLVPEPFIGSVVLGGMALLQAGSASQHEQWLAPMIEGTSSLALGYAERQSRHDVSRVATTATRDGGGWKLSGEKVFVPNGHEAEHVLISAQTPDGIGLFVVAADGPGVTRTKVKTIDGHGAGRIRLDGAAVGDDCRLGEPGDATVATLEHVLDYGAAAACAEGLGICQATLDMTVAHLKERKQFNVPIGSFQVLQHRAVEMFVEVELVRSVSILASISVEDEDPVARKRGVSAAKAKLATAGRAVTREAIQLHGGIGITDEHDIGLYFKRMVALDALFGDEVHHVERFSALPTFMRG
ncbi:MAG: acyl-CoA dehydrogenase family protein [Myxococcota bacterium]